MLHFVAPSVAECFPPSWFMQGAEQHFSLLVLIWFNVILKWYLVLLFLEPPLLCALHLLGSLMLHSSYRLDFFENLCLLLKFSHDRLQSFSLDSFCRDLCLSSSHNNPVSYFVSSFFFWNSSLLSVKLCLSVLPFLPPLSFSLPYPFLFSASLPPFDLVSSLTVLSLHSLFSLFSSPQHSFSLVFVHSFFSITLPLFHC